MSEGWGQRHALGWVCCRFAKRERWQVLTIVVVRAAVALATDGHGLALCVLISTLNTLSTPKSGGMLVRFVILNEMELRGNMKHCS